MYKRTTNTISVDEVRRELFVKNGRDLEAIPRMSAALLQHTLCASDVAGWNNSLVPVPDLPSSKE